MMKFMARVLFQFLSLILVLSSAYLGLNGATETFNDIFGIDLKDKYQSLTIQMTLLACLFMSMGVALSCVGIITAVIVPLSILFPEASASKRVQPMPTYINRFVNWYANGLKRKVNTNA